MFSVCDFFFFFLSFFFLFVYAATNPGLDWLDWTCFFIWSGVVVLPCGLPCPMHLCPFGVRQASVNCPLPMVKLLQTPKCYGDWRHLWAVPWTKLQPPWRAWGPKTHSTPAKPTSMYLALTDTGICQFFLHTSVFLAHIIKLSCINTSLYSIILFFLFWVAHTVCKCV